MFLLFFVVCRKSFTELKEIIMAAGFELKQKT